MKSRDFVIDCLNVHELIHWLETNHALRFWNLLSDEFLADSD
jgi:predicted metal-dependent hydrolase